MKQSNIEFVEVLPQINDSKNIIILEFQKSNLGSLWFEFIERIIEISLQGKYYKVVGDALKSSGGLHLIKRSYARNLLGIGESLSVIDINHSEGCTKVTALMRYEELVDIYYAPAKSSEEVTFKRAVVDRFFLFLWTKGILLYPITNRPYGYQRPLDWKVLFGTSQIYESISDSIDSKEVSTLKSYKKTSIVAFLTSTTWNTLDEVTENGLLLIENALKKREKETKQRINFLVSTLNALRLILINVGRKDILKPVEANVSTKEYNHKRRFNFVDIESYPNLEYITKKAIAYYDVLKKEGLSAGTITGDISAVVIFIKYLMEYYPDREIDIQAVDDMFEPNNEVNLFMVLSSRKTAKQMLNKMIKFLVYCELYSTKAKKNTPRAKRKVSYVPYREAMPKEMVQHIVDIIKNRPPMMRLLWDRERADISWWKHEVYPAYPMMMLFGYYIPVRGEQVRNLCRKKSFIIKDEKLETIIINTDKNVNRKHYQEIPCVWDDLQLFMPYLQWHKSYYKNMPTCRYHDDDNSPWEDIEPLFNTPQVLKPISSTTHFAYHKKVLCQYQLELMQNAKENGKSQYPIVAWAKDGKEFFKDIAELNSCNTKRLDDIAIAYDLHSLRVTGATRYLESGVGINLVMQLTGHVTPNTLLKVYTVLSLQEKKEKLRSAVQNIYFGDSGKLLENTSDLIGGELVGAYEKGKNELEGAFKDNALFSINSKVPQNAGKSEYKLGVEIAKEHHPHNWFPMVHGICPAVKCPSGREHRCSLCPYLITGKLFIDGVMLKANQALAKFQRDSMQKIEEDGVNYKNQSLAESLEITLEEILGWQDILEKINDNLSSEGAPVQNKPIEYKEGSRSAFAFKEMERELTYLSNAYDARMIGVEQDRVGLKILTIKAMKIANEKKDTKAFNAVANEELEAIDYLVGYYTGKKIKHDGFMNFIENIKKPKK